MEDHPHTQPIPIPMWSPWMGITILTAALLSSPYSPSKKTTSHKSWRGPNWSPTISKVGEDGSHGSHGAVASMDTHPPAVSLKALYSSSCIVYHSSPYFRFLLFPKPSPLHRWHSFSLSFHTIDFDSSIDHLQNALNQISFWMTANLLTLLTHCANTASQKR